MEDNDRVDSHRYAKADLERRLDRCTGRTLGQIDAAGVFQKAAGKTKVTGIAGDVIEQSVMGYPANSDQEPDLIVDGFEVELKTTGLRRNKKGGGYEAKEPMSITAVSLKKIASEEFYRSNFWHKSKRMLIVYYLYDSEETVQAMGYADFPLVGYQFHCFDYEEREMLRSDWELVRDFVRQIEQECPDEESRKTRYPLLSSALRRELMLIDTAPKYPHSPRFRLKRSTVTAIARKHFGDGLSALPEHYSSFAMIDRKLHELAQMYYGGTLGEMASDMGVVFDSSKSNKNLAEQVVVRFFGGTGKMEDIELFAKIGLKAKSITLTPTGARTEDMKLFTIDFGEFVDGAEFEESLFAEYFSNNQLLCPVFEEPGHAAPLTDNIFKGFKRIAFDDAFLEGEVKPVWSKILHLVVNHELADVVCRDGEGRPIVNRTGVTRSAPNLPKAKDGLVFVRGTSADSTKKPECVNGVRMYKQQVWVKGSYIADRLKETSWI